MLNALNDKKKKSGLDCCPNSSVQFKIPVHLKTQVSNKFKILCQCSQISTERITRSARTKHDHICLNDLHFKKFRAIKVLISSRHARSSLIDKKKYFSASEADKSGSVRVERVWIPMQTQHTETENMSLIEAEQT